MEAILKHPDEIYPLLKLRMAVKNAEKQRPPEPHWAFCYSMLPKLSRSFALVIRQLRLVELRNAVCVFYLVLRALDTVGLSLPPTQRPHYVCMHLAVHLRVFTDHHVNFIREVILTAYAPFKMVIEDDTSIATDVKLPILKAFHQHIYDCEWHFSSGTKEYKVLMDEFHHVSTAFLELERRYQVSIEDIIKRMGAGMAKFICKEVETVEDYDEYCHYVAGLVGLGLSKLFHNAGLEDLASDDLSNSMGLFLQKTNIIRDYLEDINEIPKSRMFWPREIWSKYVNKLEDLKYEQNSEKAVQCLNEMVTNALSHVEDCLTYMSALRDNAVFRFCAIPQVMAIGTLALCYNNIQVFRGVVKMRRGLTAIVIDRTNTMPDVYGAFFDFTCMMKPKVDRRDPNATKTLNRIEAIQKICRDSGTLSQRKLYVLRSKTTYSPIVIMVIFAVLAIILARLSAGRQNDY